MNTLILTWGLLPMFLGIGFVFKPELIARLEKAYAKQARRFQTRFFKAHRATGLGLILASVVILLSWFYPVWIFNCFLIARVVVGALFPSHFPPLQGTPIIPTHFI